MAHRFFHLTLALRLYRAAFILVCSAAALTLGFTTAAQAQARPRYSVTDLGQFTNAPGYSEAHGINNAGQVVGRGLFVNASRAFLWSPGTGAPLDVGSLPRFPSANARAINGFGQAVGATIDGDKTRAFLWTPTSSNHPTSGSLTEITGLPGETNHSSATAINNRGQVVGISSEFGFLWTPSAPNAATGTAVDLGSTPDGGRPIPTSINVAGRIVGVSSGLTGERAFLWTPNTPNGSTGSMIDLGNLPGATGTSQALAINDASHIVGNSVTATGGRRAFLWTPASGGTMRDLGDLAGGNDESFALSINSTDAVVGYSNGADSDHAFLWTPAIGTMLDLNTLLDSTGTGWTLRFAYGINDAGQIVGFGTFDPDGPGDIAPAVHAFLLTPRPAPQLTSVVRSATNGHVILSGTGAPNEVHAIEATNDLTQGFTFLTTVTAAADGTWHFEDTGASEFPARFYRVVYP